RMLVGKVPLSQKSIALALADLEDKGILKSRSQGGVKYYGLNLKYSEIRDVVMITEIARKAEFLAGHRKLAHLFKEDARTVGIFGSYARGTEKEDSDVDAFVIGNKKNGDYDETGRLLDLDVSIKYFAPEEWTALLKEKNNLVKEMAKSHVVIFGVEWFVNALWRDYYGFN
ncbi:nucleotidyltransferase domain-containing protein, partial [Candidatus Woesearchaeota archaeon]|nr:nucleotidyltransferase domain-containing protein [Candidatus Woesearchaeota archaeon]